MPSEQCRWETSPRKEKLIEKGILVLIPVLPIRHILIFTFQNKFYILQQLQNAFTSTVFSF